MKQFGKKKTVHLILAALVFLMCLSCVAAPTPIQEAAAYSVEVMSGSKREYIGSLGDWLVKGKVKNTGSRTLRFVKIRGTIKDGGGNVIGDYTTYMDSDTLTPGATSPFSIYIADPSMLYGGNIRLGIESARFAD